MFQSPAYVSTDFAPTLTPIGMAAPLIWLASSEARKSSVSAMDSGFVHVDGSVLGILARLAGVSMVLGSTPLTVTPDPLSSSASTLINATRLDLETIYAAAPGNGSTAAQAATCRMRPVPRATM